MNQFENGIPSIDWTFNVMEYIMNMNRYAQMLKQKWEVFDSKITEQ